ncbi:MAG: hypothetical protein SFY80_02765 [Verrucomicrobiota bacterium]|nr:hypothetical protein [Verrucomicrobiota bacterium]
MSDLLFSESWHLVAGQRIRLRPNINMRKQMFRGESWYVIGDPYTNNFYRFRPTAQAFIARLDGKMTVEEVWNTCLKANPDETPGQQEVIQALAQLHAANLIVSDLPPDASQMFNRVVKQRQQKVKNLLSNFLFLRIPVWDPDRFLNRIRPAIHLLINNWVLIAWVLLCITGLKVAADNYKELLSSSAQVLEPRNLALLYITWGVVKFLHEMGHAAMTKRFGGEVHNMGLMFLVFTPVPYVDATAAWGFRERYKRILVGSAGMMVEFAIASVAVIIWSAVGSPGAIKQIAYNIIFLSSVSTLLFNINPLMRFDGYYILCDLLDVPNLQSVSFNQLRYTLERYVFRMKQAVPVAITRRGAFWLNMFGAVSSVYRVVLLTGIILFIGQQFFGVGIVLAVFGLVMWAIVPVVKLGIYVLTNSRLQRVRMRACGIIFGTLGLIVLFICLFPWPMHFRSPGVIRAHNSQQFINQTDGYMRELLAKPGTWVQAGQPLLRLENPGIDPQLRRYDAQLEEYAVRRRWAQDTNPSYIEALNAMELTAHRGRDRVVQSKEGLNVSSSTAGYWFSPFIADYEGAWVARGTPLGEVVDTRSFYFSAIVSQKEVSLLFDEPIRDAEIRIRGEAAFEIEIPRDQITILPVDQNRLPTASLGWAGGGTIQVQQDDKEGTRTVEPFFEVRLELRDGQGTPELAHLRSGIVRFDLAPRPLWEQWMRRFRQMLQERYQM